MNQKYLENLIGAKESLKIWIGNLEQKNLGNEMFSSEVELDKNRTDFAKWYYGEGQTFSSFKDFRHIETYYNDMYEIFQEYNYLSKLPIKRSLFSNNAEKRRISLNKIYQKIELSYKELLVHVKHFQNTLINSPLFADLDVVSEFNETQSIETKNEFDFDNPFEENKLHVVETTENIDESELETSSHDVDDSAEQCKSPTEDEKHNTLDVNSEFNSIDDYINQKTSEFEKEDLPDIDSTNDFFRKEDVLEGGEVQNIDKENTFELDVSDNIEDIETTKKKELSKAEIEAIESEVYEEMSKEESRSDQLEDKETILDITSKSKKKTQIEFTEEPEIDIEEEIRRILS